MLKAKADREKQLEADRKAKLKQAEAERKAKLKAREELRKEKERAYKERLKQKEKERKEKERAYKQKLKEKEKARKEALRAKETGGESEAQFKALTSLSTACSRNCWPGASPLSSDVLDRSPCRIVRCGQSGWYGQS